VVNEITPIQIITKWRTYVKIVSQAVKAVTPEAEVYVAGGAAEKRLTVKSDIDVLIVLPHKLGFEKAAELHAKILEVAEELGLPPYAPVEFHIISKEELKRYAKTGKIIPVSEI